jgi:hypothetical protein
MAFSAHNEMGQNERIETVSSTTSRPRTGDSESKVCIYGFELAWKNIHAQI